MNTLVYPALYAVLLWWFLTGAILYLNGLPRWTFKWSMSALTLIAMAALFYLAELSSQTSVAAAYGAFTCTIVLWGWQEAAFLLGYATGPRRVACPAQAEGWPRFKMAFMALLYHELALLLLGIAIAAVTWNTVNPLGLWIYGILWLMRLSAKLNIFLGVRNLNDGILPKHLEYLQTYFRRRPANLLFPFSILLSSWAAVLIWTQYQSASGAFDASALSFAGTLLSLAILEHWFMVIPFTVDGLWKWGLRSRESRL
jgi:putative photosynthetic complex assembly protein 2